MTNQNQPATQMKSFLIRDILSGNDECEEEDDRLRRTTGDTDTDDDDEDEELEIDVDSEEPMDEIQRHKELRQLNNTGDNNNKQQRHKHHHEHAQHEQDHQTSTLKRTHDQHQQHLQTPLDALFQMASSTFDTLKRGEKRKEAPSETAINLATTKGNPKKKRKSRTAFTNSQIYELERRFRLQKYLSPTDRDEIAMTLNLSNAQVITWFQNRRAKMKRDLEEQRRDIETASLLNLQKTFLESFQALSQMMTPINGKE